MLWYALTLKITRFESPNAEVNILLPDTFKPTTDRHGMTRILDVDWG